MAKPRADKKLARLPAHQKEMLRRWLVEENVSYKDAKEKLYQDFNVETSEGALSKFFAEECFTERFEQASVFADQVAEQLAAEGADKFDAATIALVKQKAFERAVAKDGSIKELALLAGIIGDTAKLQLKERELELNWAKYRLAASSAIEKALDALYEEIKDKPFVLEHFERFKAAAMESIPGKEVSK